MVVPALCSPCQPLSLRVSLNTIKPRLGRRSFHPLSCSFVALATTATPPPVLCILHAKLSIAGDDLLQRTHPTALWRGVACAKRAPARDEAGLLLLLFRRCRRSSHLLPSVCFFGLHFFVCGCRCPVSASLFPPLSFFNSKIGEIHACVPAFSAPPPLASEEARSLQPSLFMSAACLCGP